MRPEVLADSIGDALRAVLQPVMLRVAELEAAGPREAIARDTAIRASLGGLEARLASLEAREASPGPAGPVGPTGPPGPPGRDGIDGKDARLNYLGTWVSGKTYDCGDLVTDHGSVFYCSRSTTGRPEASPDWKLMVKRGRDGKDLR